eukprot:scaffold128017_cov17-Tisochrysis_lutea.AAC.1
MGASTLHGGRPYAVTTNKWPSWPPNQTSSQRMEDTLNAQLKAKGRPAEHKRGTKACLLQKRSENNTKSESKTKPTRVCKCPKE